MFGFLVRQEYKDHAMPSWDQASDTPLAVHSHLNYTNTTVCQASLWGWNPGSNPRPRGEPGKCKLADLSWLTER